MVRFNPYAPSFVANPYPQYQALRDEDPVHRAFMGVWLLTAYADVSAALIDRRLGSDLSKWTGYQVRYGRDAAISWLFDNWLLNADRPRHRRLREVFDDVFATIDRQDYENTIVECIESSLTELVESGPREVDIVARFVKQIPFGVINMLLGIPTEHWPAVCSRSVDVSKLIEPLPDRRTLRRASGAIAEFREILDGILKPGTRRPGFDLIGRLAEDSRISRDELGATCIFLLTAGHETTVNLIGTGLFALLARRKQWEWLGRNPSWVGTAVEEMLRFESPVQIVWRTSLSDLKIRDKTIRQGEQVMLCLGSANRDPDFVPEPDEFNCRRGDIRPLSFGGGRHICLGAALARLEAKAVIQTLLDRLPGLRLAGAAPDWLPNINLRGLNSLYVSF